MKQLFLILCLVFKSLAADLTCPTAAVTSATPKGEFPVGGSAQFPANYACGIQFQIPVGQVVKFGIQNSLTYFSQDNFTIQDAMATVYQFYMPDKEFYAPPTTAKVQISTISNVSSFYFTWQYIDITNFTRIQNPTGTIISLNLTANSFYQFTSAQDRVAFHTGSLSGTTDLSLPRIYVYDGEDLTANFVGNLEYFTNKNPVSTGKSLTLVNFYGNQVNSYGIANDYFYIGGFEDYSFVLITNINSFLHVTSSKGQDSAITYYSVNTDVAYITQLAYLYPEIDGQEVGVRALTPSDKLDTALLTFNTDSTLASLPQQIPSNTFTVIFHQCDVYINLASGSSQWTNVSPGRLGSIISPSLWNPKMPVTPPYLAKLDSASKLKFSIDLISVFIGDNGAKLTIEVGSIGTNSSVYKFDKTANYPQVIDAYGTFMTTTFTGTTSASSFKMKFIINEDVETTTKSTSTTFNFIVLVLILVNLL